MSILCAACDLCVVHILCLNAFFCLVSAAWDLACKERCLCLHRAFLFEVKKSYTLQIVRFLTHTKIERFASSSPSLWISAFSYNSFPSVPNESHLKSAVPPEPPCLWRVDRIKQFFRCVSQHCISLPLTSAFFWNSRQGGVKWGSAGSSILAVPLGRVHPFRLNCKSVDLITNWIIGANLWFCGVTPGCWEPVRDWQRGLWKHSPFLSFRPRCWQDLWGPGAVPGKSLWALGPSCSSVVVRAAF